MASSYSESLGESKYFPAISQKTAPLRTGGFAIMFLIEYVTPGQPWIKGCADLSSRQTVVVTTKVSLPPRHRRHADHMLFYTKTVSASASGKVILVGLGFFFLFQMIHSRLFLRAILPKLGPARGTALYSWEVDSKGLWLTRAGERPQQDTFTLLSVGKRKAPWKETWKAKQDVISEFLNWDSTL